MKTLLLIISLLLIAIVLLQGSKSGNSTISLTGANDSLFKNRKERGGELVITRLTAILGAAFLVICAVFNFM